jgi:hypothetical protein
MTIKRGVDNKGAFYCFGKKGKRFYYVIGDPASRSRARRKAAGQGRALHSFKGAGIFDLKSDYPNQIKRYIEQYGGEQVKKIEIRRKPINSYLDTVINILSLGKFDEAKKMLHYDKMFHVFMQFVLESGKVLRVDKDEIVKIMENRLDEGQVMTVLVYKSITFKDMFDNLVAMDGYHTFDYTAGEWNCQRFTRDMLAASNMLAPTAERWIMQDAVTLMKHLPGVTVSIMNALTNFASWLHKLWGSGARRRRSSL